LDDLLPATLAHLEWLVAARTENPPKRIDDSRVMERLARELSVGFDVRLTDLGDGSMNLYARRGDPKILWNFHLDTVPAATSWTGSPFELRVEAGRAVGLGACDIKGAAAAMLAAVQCTTGDVALLFSSDEEAGKGRCVAAFLDERIPFDGVVVAEPTKGLAVLAHRGIGTSAGRFVGLAGHASGANALTDSATHEVVRWASRALHHAHDTEAAPAKGTALRGLRFNLGRVEGGEKPNVIAAEARVRFGVRPPPGIAPREALAIFQGLAPDAARVTWETGFLGAPLPADSGDALALAGDALAHRLGIIPGPAADYWTEAALFSERGIPALVFGSGDIAQAHTKDEWVSTSELREVAATYRRILTTPR
jgi:acetylornithine deacetylase